jgi:hypothetical protein
MHYSFLQLALTQLLLARFTCQAMRYCAGSHDKFKSDNHELIDRVNLLIDSSQD